MTDADAAETQMGPVFAFATKIFGREPCTNEDGEHVWIGEGGWSVGAVYGVARLSFWRYGSATEAEMMQIYAVLGYAMVKNIPVTIDLDRSQS
jgi:hypothetical protein